MPSSIQLDAANRRLHGYFKSHIHWKRDLCSDTEIVDPFKEGKAGNAEKKEYVCEVFYTGIGK